MSASPTGRIYVLRHGETEWSRDGRHTSRTDLPLTEKGRDAARTAGRLLVTLRGLDVPRPVVWTSPRQRATETARLAGLEPDAVREDLVEWDYGAYEGRTTPESREEVPGWTVWTHPCPGGETGAEVAARLDRVLADADTSNGAILGGHLV